MKVIRDRIIIELRVDTKKGTVDDGSVLCVSACIARTVGGGGGQATSGEDDALNTQRYGRLSME